MRKIVVKYKSLVEDGQWNTKYEKDVKILSLTRHVQELNILFAKQSTSQEINKNKNGGKNSINNGGSSWKTIDPKSGESWTKEKNGRSWHWCKWH